MENLAGRQLDNHMHRKIAAFADRERPVVLDVLATRELTDEQLVSETGLDPATASEHLSILGRAALIPARKDGHRRLLALRKDALADVATWCDSALAARPAGDDVPDGVRQFFSGRRLNSLPVRQSRRVEVPAVLIRDFEPSKVYLEAEVSQILLARHPDFPTLRRALIDVGLLRRSAGAYRRAN